MRPVNEILRHSRRCLERGIGNEIGDGFVPVVPYARNHWQWKLADVLTYRQLVEAREVGLAAATTDYYHAVVLAAEFSNGIELLYNRRRRTVALYRRFKQCCRKFVTVLIAVQLLGKIAEARRCGRRYYGYPLHKPWQGEALVHIKNTIRLELIDGALSLHGYFASGVFWEYVGDIEAKTVNLVEGYFGFHHYLDARLELPPRS
jgi:hypothetical protein